MRVLANTSIVFSLLLSVGIASAQQPAAPTAPGKQVPDSQSAQEQSDDMPATEAKTDEESAASTKEKASYILGYVALSSLMRQKIDIDFDKFMEGIQTAHEGKPLGMGREEVMSVQSAFQRSEQKRITAMIEQQTKANKEEGEKLMEEFAKQEVPRRLKMVFSMSSLSPVTARALPIPMKSKSTTKASMSMERFLIRRQKPVSRCNYPFHNSFLDFPLH